MLGHEQKLIEAERSVLLEVIKALQGFDSATQRRILNTAGIFFGMFQR